MTLKESIFGYNSMFVQNRAKKKNMGRSKPDIVNFKTTLKEY